MFPLRTVTPSLDLSHLPHTYLLPTHLTPEKLLEFQDKLRTCKCPLTDTASDASLFIANVNTQKRSELELRKKEIIVLSNNEESAITNATIWPIRVVKLEWLTKSLEARQAEKLEEYTVLSATAVLARPRIHTASPKPATTVTSDSNSATRKRKEILERAQTDAAESPQPKRARYGRTEKQKGIDLILSMTKKAPLLRQSTSSFEGKRPSNELPEWVRTKNTYSCCRSTPLQTPNDLFISQLKTIKHSRIISSDSVGIRAYSTAIAAIKAYPYPFNSSSEVQSLPGCDGKIAGLFEEWKSSDPDPEKRIIPAVKELEQSQTFQVLRQFESIWGVGADTATKFFFIYGFRNIGDIISQHWSKLSRVQQIGVKYYDEFLTPITGPEIEKIAALITKHAKKLIPDVQSILVGGYRRGKNECHDVDVLLSHPVDGAMYTDFLMDLLHSLESSNLITHTLSVSTPKLQHIDPHRPSKSNFDTLDKALLVWQAKKGRLHRRVDIIIAPTICAGTALLGWTGGTTFERDLRLYCEKEHRWKFSSQGVWRGNERVPGTEGWKEGESWEDVERRVMETVGIGWRPPSERCTG